MPTQEGQEMSEDPESTEGHAATPLDPATELFLQLREKMRQTDLTQKWLEAANKSLDLLIDTVNNQTRNFEAQLDNLWAEFRAVYPANPVRRPYTPTPPKEKPTPAESGAKNAKKIEL